MSSEPGSVQTVVRALKLLRLFTTDRPWWTVTDLSRATNLHKSIVTRMMSTMAQEGFVVQDPATRSYGVGPQAFAVGSVYQPYAVLHRLGHPVMEDLVAKSGHSVAIGVPTGKQFMVLHSIQGNGSLRVAFEPGERPYFHAASIGKALLSGMTDDEVREIVGPNPLPKVTQHTIESLEALFEDLEQVRESGVSETREEALVGIGGVASAITDISDRYVAALGVAYPIHMVTDSEIESFKGLVREGAQSISSRFLGTTLGPV
jgi:DNA-binding IclR family transcriptional regulator